MNTIVGTRPKPLWQRVIWAVITLLAGLLCPGAGIVVAAVLSFTLLREETRGYKVLLFVLGALTLILYFLAVAGLWSGGTELNVTPGRRA